MRERAFIQRCAVVPRHARGDDEPIARIARGQRSNRIAYLDPLRGLGHFVQAIQANDGLTIFQRAFEEFFTKRYVQLCLGVGFKILDERLPRPRETAQANQNRQTQRETADCRRQTAAILSGR